MDSSIITAIFNPASGNGRTRKLIGPVTDALRQNLKTEVEVRVTTRRGEACDFACDAAKDGRETVIAIGGDGTINEVANGLMSCGRTKNLGCKLGIVSSGTGQGLAEGLGLPVTIAEQLKLIGSGNSRSIEVGRVTWGTAQDGRRSRYFVNECQAGIGGHVVKSFESGGSKRRGFLGFGLTTLRLAMRLANSEYRVTVDEERVFDSQMLGVVVANGTHTGGGMNLTPRARFDDGKLDVLLICTTSVLSRLINLPKIYSARHLRSPQFTYIQARTISISAGEPVPLEADGELIGSLPAEICVIPNALEVYGPERRARHE